MKNSSVVLLMFVISALCSGYIAFKLTGDITIAFTSFAVIDSALLGLAFAMQHAADKTE